MISAAVSKSMFSSWSPSSALVAGVKIGRGSLSDSCRPSGRPTPQTEPLSWYSFQPEPDRYPRTTHSIGYIWSLRTRTARPSTSSGTSLEMKWFGQMSFVFSNQKFDIWVRTLPLSGILVGMITS